MKYKEFKEKLDKDYPIEKYGNLNVYFVSPIDDDDRICNLNFLENIDVYIYDKEKQEGSGFSPNLLMLIP